MGDTALFALFWILCPLALVLLLEELDIVFAMLTIFSNKPGFKLDNNSCKLVGGFDAAVDAAACGGAEWSVGDVRSSDDDFLTGAAMSASKAVGGGGSFDVQPLAEKSVSELVLVRSIWGMALGSTVPALLGIGSGSLGSDGMEFPK